MPSPEPYVLASAKTTEQVEGFVSFLLSFTAGQVSLLSRVSSAMLHHDHQTNDRDTTLDLSRYAELNAVVEANPVLHQQFQPFWEYLGKLMDPNSAPQWADASWQAWGEVEAVLYAIVATPFLGAAAYEYTMTPFRLATNPMEHQVGFEWEDLLVELLGNMDLVSALEAVHALQESHS